MGTSYPFRWPSCNSSQTAYLPLPIQPDPAHSTTESRYFVLGQTNGGRHLFLAFTLRKDKIRVISARDMSKKERAAYGEANP